LDETGTVDDATSVLSTLDGLGTVIEFLLDNDVMAAVAEAGT
jgi:hypothetical protein